LPTVNVISPVVTLSFENVFALKVYSESADNSKLVSLVIV
jgi:hypothetical protein